MEEQTLTFTMQVLPR